MSAVMNNIHKFPFLIMSNFHYVVPIYVSDTPASAKLYLKLPVIFIFTVFKSIIMLAVMNNIHKLPFHIMSNFHYMIMIYVSKQSSKWLTAFENHQ